MEIAALIILLLVYQRKGLDKPLYNYEKIIFDFLNTSSSDTQNCDAIHSNRKHLSIKKATGLGISEFMLRLMVWLERMSQMYTESVKSIERTNQLYTESFKNVEKMNELYKEIIKTNEKMNEPYKDIQRINQDWLDLFWRPWLTKDQENKDKTQKEEKT